LVAIDDLLGRPVVLQQPSICVDIAVLGTQHRGRLGDTVDWVVVERLRMGRAAGGVVDVSDNGVAPMEGDGAAVTPFTIDVPEGDLVDLRRRLDRARWPERETVDDWSQGVPLTYLQDLCGYWRREYDWRATEARLNRLDHFRSRIDGVDIHFVHVPSSHPDALPVIITHGWPGSFLEFEAAIGPLTDPTAHGGRSSDAFSVVLPSLPGYGFSGRPAQPGWGLQRIADAWAQLMHRLGYSRFGAQGGDWGSSVTTCLAQQHPERLVGILLTPPLAAPDPATFADLTDAEQASLDALRHADSSEDGYSAEQSTKPQTIGYSLVDSPAGLCAWIVEKFRTWTDCDGVPENALTRDQMLDDITLYWLTGTGASAARLYWESIREVQEIFTTGTGDRVDVPTGGSLFVKENPRPSQRWAARRFTDLRYWNEVPRGGHFAAFEQPDLFVEEMRAFFRPLR
jgi:pimeloyl-ACP methyl ester carboxylesterase